MYSQLFEKLMEVEVATEVAPQKQMRKFYKSVLNSKLKLSTHYREKWYKFIILTNGDLIPVESAHSQTAEAAGLRFSEIYFNGAAAGSYDQAVGSLQVDAIRLTRQQISKLKQLYIEYKPTTLLVDVEKKLGSFCADVKSVDELDYLLTYGKVHEAVAVVPEVDRQKVLKGYYKREPKKLTLSTWPTTREGNEYKFWLLQDGTVIPVRHSHVKTLVDADIDIPEGGYSGRVSFMETGAIAGYFNLVTDEMGVESGKKLTQKQISALKNLYIEYKVGILYADTGSIHLSMQVIKSVDHLDYLLTYGKDVEEVKLQVEQMEAYSKLFEQLNEVESKQVEKEEFFLDRTNKHIQLVQGAAAKILDAYPEYDTDILRDQIEVHDASKLEEPERTPYIEITWRHKLENEKGEFDPYKGKGYRIPGKLEKEDENEACLHHVTTNSHHPEHHVREEDRSDESDECVDAFLMPPSDIVEMVADWQAMSEELQTNTSREWFEKQKDVRWHFTEEQEEQIDKLLVVFEERGVRDEGTT